jgi:hypothetical protein
MQIYLVFYPDTETYHEVPVKVQVDLNRLGLTTVKVEALFWYVITNLRKRPPTFLRYTRSYIELKSVTYRSTDDMVDVDTRNKTGANMILPPPIKIWGSKSYSITYRVNYIVRKSFGRNYPYYVWKRRQDIENN